MKEYRQSLPPELARTYDPLACLKEEAGRQTWLVRELESGRTAILKCCADGSEDLEEEAQLLARLPEVPAVYAWGREGRQTWLAREYIPGETLLDYAQKRGPLPEEEVREVGLALCRELKGLHGQIPPVIHRDIKAENVIRTPEGRYVLIDFGIARRYAEGAPRDTQVLGTPASAPPEQFGYRQTDPRSDVYALGVLLHQLVTGEMKLDQGDPGRLLGSIIRRCTSFAPEGRYAGAAALELALRRAGKRRRWPVLLAATAALALLAGLGLLREPVLMDRYVFADAAIEAEVCRQLNKEPGTVTYGDLEAVESILLCGEERFERWEQLTAYGQEVQLDYTAVVSRGSVSSLKDIPQMKNLRTLALCSQEIRDISPLADCGVRRLALHGNQISDVTALGRCPALEELFISHNPVSDLSPLAGCQWLWKLNAGATALETLDSLAALPGLGTLYLYDCGSLGDDLSALEQAPCLTTLHLRPVSRSQLETVSGLTRLQALGLWRVEGMEDLTALSRLTELDWLFLDVPELTSLDGVEEMRRLRFLDVRSAAALDVSALAGLEALCELAVPDTRTADWQPLAALPALERVRCAEDQEEAVRQVLNGKRVELTR